MLAAVAITALWVLWAGKEVSWDSFNHHLYLPFSLVSGRYAQDLFAAGPQSYQNPLGYLPFYALVRAGLPSWQIGMLLAATHALAAWPLHRLATELWEHDTGSMMWRLLAVAAAWCTPAFLILAGSSSVDALGNVLVLWAIAALLSTPARIGTLIAGGIALGLAVAIKPTSGIFAIAMAPVILGRLLLRQCTPSQAAAFAAAALGGALAGLAQWSTWLWSTFGNPVFPLFNQYFGSPYAPSDPIIANRFLSDDPWRLLTRLWDIAEFRSFTYTEAFAPDVRPLLAAVLLVVALTLQIVRGRGAALLYRSFWTRADVQLGVLTAASYWLWVVTSGNARYAVTLFTLFAVMFVRAAFLVLPSGLAPALVGLALAAQAFYYVDQGDRRFISQRWDSGPYYDITASPRLRQEPFLHLSIGVQTYAVAAAYMHPGGALINVVGQMSLPTTGPLGEALNARLAKWQGRVRFLFLAPDRADEAGVMTKVENKLDSLTYRLGLRIDTSDCESIWVDRNADRAAPDAETQPLQDGPRTTAGGAPGREQAIPSPAGGSRLMSCKAVARPRDNPELEAAVVRADRVFELLETSCPRIYGPRAMASDVGRDVVQRRYMNSDLRVNVSPTEGVTLTHFRSLLAISLGSIDHVMANRGADACKAWQKLNVR